MARRGDLESDEDDAKGIPLVVMPKNAEAPSEENELVRKARDVLARRPGAIQVWLKNETGEFPKPLEPRSVEELATLPALIFPIYGGGDFDYRVRIAGSFIHGAWERVKVAGDPRPLGAKAQPAPEPATATRAPQLDEEAIRAKVLRELEEKAEREARESERLAQAVAAAMAPIGKALEVLAAKTNAPPPPPVAKEDEIERFKRLKDIFAPPGVTPEQLKAEDAARKAAERAEAAEARARAQELEAQREREERRDRELADLKRILKKKRRVSPTLELGARAQEARALHELVEAMREKAEATDSGVLRAFLAPLEGIATDLAGQLGKAVQAAAKKKIPQVAAAAAAAASASSGPSVEVPGTWQAWVMQVFDDGKLVANEPFIRASLERYPKELDGLSRIETKGALLECVRAVLGPLFADQIDALDEASVAMFLRALATLRATVVKVKATPGPSSPAEPSAPSEPEGAQDDESEDTKPGEGS